MATPPVHSCTAGGEKRAYPSPARGATSVVVDATLSLCPLGHLLTLVAAAYVLGCVRWAFRELVHGEELHR